MQRGGVRVGGEGLAMGLSDVVTPFYQLVIEHGTTRASSSSLILSFSFPHWPRCPRHRMSSFMKAIISVYSPPLARVNKRSDVSTRHV